MAAALLVPLALGVFLYLAIKAGVGAPGRSLRQKFIALGTLTGRPEAEIVAACGPPTARSTMAVGYLLQWQATGYHIALKFGADGLCVGVTHEHAAR